VDTTDEAWHKSIDVMQHGVFYGMRAAARHMLPQRSGSVVTTSSIRGFSSNPGRIAYCAAKAAVLMMTRVAAAEWAPFGVRANAIAPGVQHTPMWDQDAARGAVDEEAILRVLPAGRLGEPSEVGKLVVFLCSDEAAYINGSSVTIDGALTAVPSG
jgi:NAD(P)-dependent dehydrogenase (short-subunit alcohol dehydrogenase family)